MLSVNSAESIHTACNFESDSWHARVGASPQEISAAGSLGRFCAGDTKGPRVLQLIYWPFSASISVDSNVLDRVSLLWVVREFAIRKCLELRSYAVLL